MMVITNGNNKCGAFANLCYTRDSPKCHKAIPLTSVSQSVNQSVNTEKVLRNQSAIN